MGHCWNVPAYLPTWVFSQIDPIFFKGTLKERSRLPTYLFFLCSKKDTWLERSCLYFHTFQRIGAASHCLLPTYLVFYTNTPQLFFGYRHTRSIIYLRILTTYKMTYQGVAHHKRRQTPRYRAIGWFLFWPFYGGLLGNYLCPYKSLGTCYNLLKSFSLLYCSLSQV